MDSAANGGRVCAIGFRLTDPTIAKLESGARKSVTAEEITALAHGLRATPAELLGWQADTQDKPSELWPQVMRDQLRKLNSVIQDAAQQLGIQLTQKPMETAPPLAGVDILLHLLIMVQEDSGG